MKKLSCIIGIILGFVLIYLSFSTTIPPKIISTYGLRGDEGYERYVNGDAYNFQIEASLRGGEIAGAIASKAIYLASGLILCSGSFIALSFAQQDKAKSIVLSQDGDNVQKPDRENESTIDIPL